MIDNEYRQRDQRDREIFGNYSVRSCVLIFEGFIHKKNDQFVNSPTI